MLDILTRTDESVEMVHWSDSCVTASLTVMPADGEPVPITEANEHMHRLCGWLRKVDAEDVTDDALVVSVRPLNGTTYTRATMESDAVKRVSMILKPGIESSNAPDGVDLVELLMVTFLRANGLARVIERLTVGEHATQEEDSKESATKSAEGA